MFVDAAYVNMVWAQGKTFGHLDREWDIPNRRPDFRVVD